MRSARDIVVAVVREFIARDLLSYASAIAFQVLFATVPLALAALAVLGLLGLEDVWAQDLAPQIRDGLQEDSFAVLNRAVEDILTSKRQLWLTFGLLFATWQVASAIRAAIKPLNEVYAVGEARSVWRRLLVSLAVAVAVLPLFVLAIATVGTGDELAAGLGLGGIASASAFLARWGLTALLLLAVVSLVLRFGPAEPRPLRWVGAGSLVVVGGWILATLGYVTYLTTIASYESVYGGLAALIALMSYVYLLALVFLAGVLIDAVLRRRLGFDGRGQEDDEGATTASERRGARAASAAGR